jgi:hypothetical protein
VAVAFSAATFITATSVLPATAAEKPAASEIGVTPTELHIAVIADVDTPLAPGAYAGARDAVEGFGKYINQQGGLAGRKVVVDFYDSKLNGDETRNAILKACQSDFAMVGTGALFLNNVDDMLACPDAKGAKTGLPDVPVVSLWEPHQNSPVSFPITAPAKVFTDPSGQTYQARVGRFRWYLQHVSKDLHGIFLVGADLPALKTASMPIWLGAQKVGVKSVRRARRRRAGQVPPHGHRDAVARFDHRVERGQRHLAGLHAQGSRSAGRVDREGVGLHLSLLLEAIPRDRGSEGRR